jgi:hypothetical protein
MSEQFNAETRRNRGAEKEEEKKRRMDHRLHRCSRIAEGIGHGFAGITG